MSAIKRGVKKVFRGVKSVVKKIAKPLLIVGATLLTGGLAAGGFAAFSAASGAGLTGFFGAVGQTMAAGAQAIAGSLGIGSGITNAAFGSNVGATLGSGQLAQSLGFAATPAAGFNVGQLRAAQGIASAVQSQSLNMLRTAQGLSPVQQRGFMGTVGNALKNLGSSTAGQMVIAQGIMGGIQSYAAARSEEKKYKREGKDTIWGAQRRGGEGVNYMPDIDMPQFTGSPSAPPTPDEFRSRQPQYQQPVQNLAFQNPLLQQQSNVPGLMEEDEEWFAPMTRPRGIMYG